jgi:hypothetical protein
MAAVAVIFLLRLLRVLVLIFVVLVRMCASDPPSRARLDVFCSWSAPTPEAPAVLRMARPGPDAASMT